MLALVAEGRSNGEIGRALFISTKTASVHVSNILAKLGVASRGEAVAVARSAGLLERLGGPDRVGRRRRGVRSRLVAAAQREDAVGQRRPPAGWRRACARDERLGQGGEVLHVADQALRQARPTSTTSQARAGPLASTR